VSTVRLTLAASPAAVQRAAELLDRLRQEHALPADAVADMQIALDEVLANVVTHAYGGDDSRWVGLRVTVGAGLLEAEVEDDGPPFDPLSVPDPDLDAPLEERRVGGLGILFVRRLMSEVAYARRGDRNHLILRRRLTAAEEDARGGP
jgi:anti-sigma regulatory factor (Ser/Thr protein kinase)